MRAHPSVWQEISYCKSIPCGLTGEGQAPARVQELCRSRVSICAPVHGRFDDFVGSHHV